MKKILLIILSIVSIQTANSKDFATTQIFACQPEWGALAREIVGNKAKVVVAINEFQDPHFAKVNPNIIIDVRKADIIFCSGSDLEINWLPALLEKASKPEIQVGGSGYLMASDYVQKLEILSTKIEGEARGEIHPFGNPHIHLNPNNIPSVAAELLRRLLSIDPANGKYYQKNYDEFIKKWKLAIIKWEFKARDLKGMPIVVKHNSWAYLAGWLGLKVVTKLEDKAGIEPNLKHLFKVLQEAKAIPSKAIIYTVFENKEAMLWLSSRTKTKIVLLPLTISSGQTKSSNLFGLFDEIIDTLIIQNAIN